MQVWTTWTPIAFGTILIEKNTSQQETHNRILLWWFVVVVSSSDAMFLPLTFIDTHCWPWYSLYELWLWWQCISTRRQGDNSSVWLSFFSRINLEGWMWKNIIGSMALQVEKRATAEKDVCLFSFILANSVFHISCRLCRSREVKCKRAWRNKMQWSREVEFWIIAPHKNCNKDQHSGIKTQEETVYFLKRF